MSGRDDDLIDIDTEGSVYRDPLVDFIDEMRELGRVPAPVPSPALAALLRGCAPVSRVALHPVRRVTGALLAAASIAVVVAAETHDLPAPAQQVVSNVIDHLSPLHWNGIADIQLLTPAKPQAVRVDRVVHRLVLHPRAQVRTRVVAARTVVHVASTPVASSHRPAHAAVRRSAHKSRVRVSGGPQNVAAQADSATARASAPVVARAGVVVRLAATLDRRSARVQPGGAAPPSPAGGVAPGEASPARTPGPPPRLSTVCG